MATEYQYIDYTMTPIYSSTSGIASPPSIITKDNSMDMANPSAAKKLFFDSGGTDHRACAQRCSG